MVEILFRDFFIEGRDIGDFDTLVAAGAESRAGSGRDQRSFTR